MGRSAGATSRFRSDVFLTAAANALLAFLGLTTGVLAARLLGPTGRGELAGIQMWPSFIATVAMLGLPEALVYFSAREPERAGFYLGSAMSLALLSSIPFIAAGYFLMPTLLSAQPAEIVGAARWYLLLVPLYALVGLPYHPLRGRQEFLRWNALRLLPSVGWVLVLVVAWGLGFAEPRWLAGAYLVMLAALFLPVVTVVRQHLPGPHRLRAREWGPLLRFGGPSLASSIPQILSYRLDQMMMVAFLPSSVLGLYVVGVAWGSMAAPLLSAIGSVVFPRVAAQSERNEQGQLFAQAIRMTVPLSLAVGILLFAATPWGLPWVFGARFREAIGPALILVVAGAIGGLNQVIQEGLRGLGAPAAVLWAESGGLAVTALSLGLLLSRLGLIGAASASFLGCTTVCLISAAWACRLTGLSPTALLVPAHTRVRTACSLDVRTVPYGERQDE